MIILSFLSFTSLPSRMEARDVWCLPPVWNLRAVTWFQFSIPSLVLKTTLSPSLSVLSLFSCWSILLPTVHKCPDFCMDLFLIQKDVFVALCFVVVFKQGMLTAWWWVRPSIIWRWCLLVCNFMWVFFISWWCLWKELLLKKNDFLFNLVLKS